jgi:hypothetical protein
MLPWKAWRFIGLNVVRTLSLITLVLVLVSNILIMVHDINAVKSWNSGVHVTTGTNTTLADNEDLVDCEYIEGSTVPNSAAGPFWAVLNRILILIQVILLIFSEIGWPDAFFARFLPFLSDEYGVGAIGMFECLIGAQVNSHAVADFPMVVAFLLFSIGCLNFILALVFGKDVKSHRSVLSWRKRDILPKTSADLARAASQTTHSSPAWSVAPSIFNEKPLGPQPSIKGYDNAGIGYGHGYGYVFGRQGEKPALKEFILNKAVDSLPKYAPSSPPMAHGRSNSGGRTSPKRI